MNCKEVERDFGTGFSFSFGLNVGGEELMKKYSSGSKTDTGKTFRNSEIVFYESEAYPKVVRLSKDIPTFDSSDREYDSWHDLFLAKDRRGCMHGLYAAGGYRVAKVINLGLVLDYPNELKAFLGCTPYAEVAAEYNQFKEASRMATVKVPVYRCPHCNKKISSIPVNDYCAIKTRLYGNPNTVCKKCGKTYRDQQLIEPAAALTLKDPVPFWATGIRTLVVLIILAVASYGIGLVILLPAYLLLCFLSRNYRQQHKNELLLASRERLRDPAYFVRHLHSEVYLPDKSKLTPETLAIIYTRALAVMDADEVLELGPITRSVIGE